MSIRHLPASARIAKPWKNGGGITRDVHVVPEGAGLDDFDWRVSIADVASDGAFSKFPGIERNIAIISGAGIRLDIADRPSATLTPQTEPYIFPGDVATTGTLLDGPIRDLNLMVRRGKLSASMRQLDISSETRFSIYQSLVVWLSGTGSLTDGTETFSPAPLDAFHADLSAHIVVTPLTPCRLCLIATSAA